MVKPKGSGLRQGAKGGSNGGQRYDSAIKEVDAINYRKLRVGDEGVRINAGGTVGEFIIRKDNGSECVLERVAPEKLRETTTYDSRGNVSGTRQVLAGGFKTEYSRGSIRQVKDDAKELIREAKSGTDVRTPYMLRDSEYSYLRARADHYVRRSDWTNLKRIFGKVN